MARRRKKHNSFDILGNAFSSRRGRRRRKSAWGALTNAMSRRGKRRRKSGGIVGVFATASSHRRRRSRKNAGIEGAFSNALSSKKNGGGVMARSYQRNIQPRMTKTEYMSIRDEADAASADTRLSGYIRDEQISGRKSFVRRMIHIVRYRIFNWVR